MTRTYFYFTKKSKTKTAQNICKALCKKGLKKLSDVSFSRLKSFARQFPRERTVPPISRVCSSQLTPPASLSSRPDVKHKDHSPTSIFSSHAPPPRHTMSLAALAGARPVAGAPKTVKSRKREDADSEPKEMGFFPLNETKIEGSFVLGRPAFRAVVLTPRWLLTMERALCHNQWCQSVSPA